VRGESPARKTSHAATDTIATSEERPQVTEVTLYQICGRTKGAPRLRDQSKNRRQTASLRE
jgi:hypothetical protein